MATIDLRTPEARASFGLYDAANMLGSSQQFGRPRMYRDRGETLDLIVRTVAESKQPLRRAQIAGALGIKKSTYLARMITELVESGCLVESARINKWRKLEYIYWIG